ncbi:MAG TPA: hypothetical protein VNR70_07295 [Steroidobacteraceae bacterium]|nr:hypothetical protein [Steroidobacteraceae bacterium]
MDSNVGMTALFANNLPAMSPRARHSSHRRRLGAAAATLILGLATPNLRAQTAASTADIQAQLLAQYPIAKTTADGTDLVAAGAVVVLQKDNLLMCKVALPIPTPNSYKNGAIVPAGFFGIMGKLGAHLPVANGGPATDNREFVAGEKFWITKIDTRQDGVTFSLFSDPIQDQRYHGTLKFTFAKGASPTPDEVTQLVGQAFKVDAPEPAAPAASPAAAKSAQGQPPAPAGETKTIKIGQTRDHVISVFGEPTKIVQLGKKEIDYFPDMKVTFVANKVTDVN